MKRKLLFIGCNFNQLKYLKELIKKDLFIIGTDINDKAPGRALCNKFYNK